MTTKKGKIKKAETQVKARRPDKRGFKRYMRDISVVIIGVAITFIGSDWSSSRQERTKLKRNLEAVKAELEDNLKVVREAQEYYEKLALFTRYLASDRPENLDPDSIHRLDEHNNFSLVGNFFTLAIETSAFEMLKGSGSMNLIKNPDVSKSILDCYTAMDAAKSESDKYMSLKMSEVRNTIMDKEKMFYGDVLSPEFRRLYYFFAAYLNLEALFMMSDIKIEEALTLL